MAMKTDDLQFLVRNLDNKTTVSTAMHWQRAIEEAQSGRWGSQCQIEEIYHFGNDHPYLLRKIAIYSEQRGFQVIELDQEFNRYLRNSDITLPDSPRIKQLKNMLDTLNKKHCFKLIT